MKTLEAPSNEPTAGAQRVQPAEGDKQTANVSAKLKDPTEPTQTVASGTANKDGLPAFQNSTIIADTGAVFNPQSTASAVAPFVIPNEPITCGSQSVTFSTRAIDNLSDVMDALNISAATSIKYGTVHGNASAAFVNEGKVLESQLNYVVSVKVNNTGPTEPENMEFMPIEGLPAERFTEVYGDCFISGFIEGGEFNAIISISVQDKSKLSRVKEAVDLQLAVGPTPVSVGAKESFEKDHQELLEGTEITISVNWIGGGEIKRPEVPWTLANVVGVANAFPSMVARRSARTSAILMRYTSLKSFQAWRWKMAGNNPDSDWTSSHLILNYAPCALYTADLFDAMMVYKRIWKKIGFSTQKILQSGRYSADCMESFLTHQNGELAMLPETLKLPRLVRPPLFVFSQPLEATPRDGDRARS